MTSISYWKLSAIVMCLLALSIIFASNVIRVAHASGDTDIQVTPSDNSGNPKNQFEIGKTTYFKISAKYTGSDNENVLLSANVYDSTGESQGIVCSRVTLVPGDSVFTVNLAILKSAHFGQAWVYANVYSDLPSNAGIPLCSEASATFQLYILGDVSGPTMYVSDGKVNIMDMSAIVSRYWTTPSSLNWNPNLDLNKDGIVNMRDLNIVLVNITP